ncbi:hypothetical protein [Hymenobacter arizonensis]|uniref:hypothetical protein n=1 Tax=Hymenobacter arizonensis TaxID=1227077 RepID=UPI000B805F0D|nr:hypothetical protein [Hymenobacter arizonensis]
MKTKSWLFTLGFCALLLSGCAGGGVGVGVGTGYGYYPPVHPYYSPYYGGVRPYYYRPRPAVIVPRGYYRQPYRSQRVYRNDGGNISRPQYNGGSRGQLPSRRRVN